MSGGATVPKDEPLPQHCCPAAGVCFAQITEQSSGMDGSRAVSTHLQTTAQPGGEGLTAHIPSHGTSRDGHPQLRAMLGPQQKRPAVAACAVTQQLAAAPHRDILPLRHRGLNGSHINWKKAHL